MSLASQRYEAGSQQGGRIIEPYQSFHIQGGSEPLPETLLGRVTQWCPTGSVFYVKPNRSVIELTRFRLPFVKFDDERVARWFGLELARLVVELIIERDKTQKNRLTR